MGREKPFSSHYTSMLVNIMILLRNALNYVDFIIMFNTQNTAVYLCI